MSYASTPLRTMLAYTIGGTWGKVPGAGDLDVRVVRVTELKAWGRLDTSTAALRSVTNREFESRRLQPGDLLLEKSGGGPDPRMVDPRFLHLYLNHFHARGGTASMQTASTNIRNIKASEYVQVPIPTPPLREQRRIVEILEEHLSRIGGADAELARAQSRSDALLLTALRAHAEVLRLAGVPFARIGDVADTNLGKMLDAKKAHGDPTPYLANINVRWGRFDLENLKAVPLTAEERSRLTMRPGDVIVCEGGEPGRCAVWDLENSGIAYQKALHRVRVRDTRQLKPEYLALMLRESVQSGRVDGLFTGTTIKHLPQQKLRMIEVPVPEHSVQESALEHLAAVVASRERLAVALDTAKGRSDLLRRSVLAAAFEGKLTGRHTDTEVIEEMAAGRPSRQRDLGGHHEVLDA